MTDVFVNFFLIYVTLIFLFYMTDFEGDLDCDLELDDLLFVLRNIHLLFCSV